MHGITILDCYHLLFFNYLKTIRLCKSKCRMQKVNLSFSSIVFAGIVYSIHTGSGAHPASYSMGITSSLPGDKLAGVQSRPLTSI
jgi:hypothetical protein